MHVTAFKFLPCISLVDKWEKTGWTLFKFELEWLQVRRPGDTKPFYAPATYIQEDGVKARNKYSSSSSSSASSSSSSFSSSPSKETAATATAAATTTTAAAAAAASYTSKIRLIK